METVRIWDVRLEMLEPPGVVVPPPVEAVEVTHLPAPSVQHYRELYSAVGEQWMWVDRLLMPDEELAAILQHPLVEVHTLTVAGEFAGYTELDRRAPDDIELAYFGLAPGFIGKGLGKYLLNWSARQAWEYGPRRLWVHTCELDHPAALPNYEQAGFQIVERRMIDQRVP